MKYDLVVAISVLKVNVSNYEGSAEHEVTRQDHERLIIVTKFREKEAVGDETILSMSKSKQTCSIAGHPDLSTGGHEKDEGHLPELSYKIEKVYLHVQRSPSIGA